MIEIKNGYYRYPNKKYILNDITFSLDKGETLTILGKNGTGKTTMLKCIAGLLRWEKGEMLVNGVNAHKNFELLSHEIGYVPQMRNISFPYTVREMILMGRAKHIGILSTPNRSDQMIVDAIIEEFGIDDIRNCPCTELSGGQLQLVYIARSLVSNPRILILDEPESHLDFKNQHMIMGLIRRITEEKQLTCIINTHYPEHALKISDKTLLINNYDYIFGSTEDIVTEENIKKYYDIDIKMLEFMHENIMHKTIVAL